MPQKQIAAKAGRKLSGCAGESIVEVLVGTLIVSLATISLVAMIAAGARMTASSEMVMQNYYSEVAELANPSDTDRGTLALSDKSDPTKTIRLNRTPTAITIKYKKFSKDGIDIVSYVRYVGD